MSAGVIHAWRWLRQLTRAEEQRFGISIELMNFRKKEDHHKSHDLLWSFSDIVFVTTCFQMDIIYLCNMGYMLKNDVNPSFLQLMIIYVSWGPALIYMEIFLGQYIRHGCLYLKNISPLTCSTIGYGMLLTMYLFSIAGVERLADSYVYLFRTFSSELPWMVCPKGSTPATCIDRALLIDCYLKNRKDDCYPKLTPELLSSRIYYKAMHSTFTKRAALLLFGWITIYITLKRSLSHTRLMVKRLLLLMLFLFLCLLAPLVIHVGRGLSVAPFFTVRHGAFLSMTSWMTAIKWFLRDHAVVRGGYQLIGCHISPGPTAANLTIYSCALSYLITALSQTFSTGILGVLIYYMKVTRAEEELYFPRYAKLYNFYPFALGLLPVRQMWSLVFFGLIALWSISYTVVNLAILEETMYDYYPIMLRYRRYVKVILCSVGFVIGAVNDALTGPNSYEDEIVLQIGARLTIIIVFILTSSVGYIYGVERFSDDMNFLNRTQPTAYWKICWKSLPFGLLILFGRDMIVVEFPRDDVAEMTANIIYVFLLGLAVLHLLHKIIMSIKARNVTGMLFQATFLWGPPLPEDRLMRNTYNPREETKYWRKNNLCTHHCLLSKGFLHSIIFREIDSRTSKARRNTLVPDFAEVAEQSKQNQVVVEIDKVSSAQLEAFEEQVKQKVKFLEKIEEAKVKLEEQEAKVLRKHSSMTTFMEELDYQIEQMVNEAEQKAQLEKNNNTTGMQKTSSKTKQRRQPIFIPRETQRPKKLPRTTARFNQKDAEDKRTAKFHMYALQVPRFVLQPAVKIPRPPARTTSIQKKENLGASTSSASQRVREISRVEDGRPHGKIFDKSKPGLQAYFGSKSPSCRVPPKQPILKRRLQVTRKSRLPVWPLPLDTPRPTISPRLSRSSSSSSTSSREAYHQPSSYFLDVRLPPKANFPFPAFSVDIHSPSKSPGMSTASTELLELHHHPVLREILHSVHPELFPVVQRNIPGVFSQDDTMHQDILVSSERETPRPQPQPRTSIYTPVRSPRSPRPLPRKQRPTNPPIPSPRPRPMVIKATPFESVVEAEALQPSVKRETTDFPARCEKTESGPNAASTEQEVSTVDIDQAIRIRIENLLHGVRDPARTTDQKHVDLSAIAEARDVVKTVKGDHEPIDTDKQEAGTSQKCSYVSRTKTGLSGQSLATVSVAARISAFGKKIVKRMVRGSNSARNRQVLETGNENNKPSEIAGKEETPEDITLDPILTDREDAERFSVASCDEI